MKLCTCKWMCVCVCAVQNSITLKSSSLRKNLRVPKVWQELLYVTNLTFPSTKCIPTTALCLDTIIYKNVVNLLDISSSVYQLQ